MPRPLEYSPAAPKRLRLSTRFGLLAMGGGVAGLCVGIAVCRLFGFPAALLVPLLYPVPMYFVADATLLRHHPKPHDGLAVAATVVATGLAVALFAFVAPAIFR